MNSYELSSTLLGELLQLDKEQCIASSIELFLNLYNLYNIHKAERIKTNIYEEEDENTYINKYQLSKLFISTILKANPEEESYSKDTMEALESYRKAIDEIAAFMKKLKENPEERAYYHNYNYLWNKYISFYNELLKYNNIEN